MLSGTAGEIKYPSGSLNSLHESSLGYIAVSLKEVGSAMEYRVHQKYGNGGNVTVKRALMTQLRALLAVLENEEQASLMQQITRTGRSSGQFEHPVAA